MKYFFFILITILFSGCVSGQHDFVDFQNNMVGKKNKYTKPFIFEEAGKLIRADFLISGQGLTRISKDKNDNLIIHWDSAEVLENYGDSDVVGKCLFYHIVDSKTNIIIGWGYDESGNPKSCRSWP